MSTGNRLRVAAGAVCVVVVAVLAGVGGAGATTPHPVRRAEQCAPTPPSPGYTMLFDGTAASMAGWRAAGAGAFDLQEDCSVRSAGGPGVWWHSQRLGSRYSLRLDWRVAEPSDDSGVFLGFSDTTSYDAIITGMREVQIDTAQADPIRRTGAVYGAQEADQRLLEESLRPPGSWNTYEIHVDDQHLEVSLNGVAITEYTDTEPTRFNHPSHVGVQMYPEGTVWYRDIEVMDLDTPTVVPSTTTITARPDPVQVGETAVVNLKVAAVHRSPTGTITLSANGGAEASAQLVNGSASFRVGPMPGPGTVHLVASYAGDAYTQPSTATSSLTVVDAGAPPPTAPPAAPPSPPVPVAALPQVRVTDDVLQVRSGRAALRLACTSPDAACAGTAVVTRRTQTIARGSFALPPGGSAKVGLRLTRSGKRLLTDRSRVGTRVGARLRVVLVDGANTDLRVTLKS